MGTVKRGRPEKFSPAKLTGSPIPDKPGVYRFRNRETGEIDYVGETNDVWRRVREHTGSGKLDPDKHDIEWKRADGRSTSITRREVEKEWITRHSPSGNRNSGGGGRTAGTPRIPSSRPAPEPSVPSSSTGELPPSTEKKWWQFWK